MTHEDEQSLETEPTPMRGCEAVEVGYGGFGLRCAVWRLGWTRIGLMVLVEWAGMEVAGVARYDRPFYVSWARRRTDRQMVDSMPCCAVCAVACSAVLYCTVM